jgi:hypothetical protein
MSEKLGARTKSDKGDRSIIGKPGKTTKYAEESKTKMDLHNHKATGHNSSIDPGKHMHSGKG